MHGDGTRTESHDASLPLISRIKYSKVQCYRKLLLLLYYYHVQGRRPLNEAPLSALYKVFVRYWISIYILIIQPPGHSPRRNPFVPTFDLHLSTHSQMRKTCCVTLVFPFPCNLHLSFRTYCLCSSQALRNGSCWAQGPRDG